MNGGSPSTLEGTNEEGDRQSPWLRRWRVLPVIVAAGIVLASGLMILVGGAERTIQGTFTLFDSDVRGPLTACRGTVGYSDVRAGMTVTVRDADGRIIATGSTRNGSNEELVGWFSDDEGSVVDARSTVRFLEGRACMLFFDVEVDDADFYEVAVGRRGSIAFSRSELEENDWRAELTLGQS